MNRDPHHESHCDPPPPRQGLSPPSSKIVRRRQPARSLAVQLGMKTLFGLPPEFKGKIISCLPKIVCALPPGFATLAPRQAVRLINLACTSQEEKIYI